MDSVGEPACLETVLNDVWAKASPRASHEVAKERTSGSNVDPLEPAERQKGI